MPFSPAVTNFFAGLLGPNFTDEEQDPIDIQTLLDSNATQERRISELELELSYFKKRNMALHTHEQATQKKIAECLALGDRLARPESDMASKTVLDCKLRETVREWKKFHSTVVSEKKEKFEREAEAWKAKYKAFEEQVATLTSDMDSKIMDLGAAAEEVKRLTCENAMLQTAVADVARLTKENGALKEEFHLTVSDHKKTNAELEKCKKEVHGWKTAFTEKVKRVSEYHDKNVKSHLAELNEVQENCNLLREERDSAVEMTSGLTEENDRLNRELADEQLHHQIAVDIAQRAQDEFYSCKEDYIFLHHDWALLIEANSQSEKAYASLSEAHTTVLWEIEELKGACSDLLEKSKKDEKAYAASARAQAASLIVLKQFQGKVDEIKATVDRMTDETRAGSVDVTVLRKRCDTLRLRSKKRKDDIAAITEDCRNLGLENGGLRVKLEDVIKERDALKLTEDQLHVQRVMMRKILARLQGERDAIVQRLEAALLQRADALEGQLEALEMLERMKSGLVTDDGKEIGVFDEDEDVVSRVQKDDDVVSEDEGVAGHAVSDEEERSHESTGSTGVVVQLGDLDLDEEEGDNEYHDCGADMYEGRSSFENVSEGDLSGDEI
ncbi:hypothetical protein SLS60_005265 [Paraconiothyrium brasiliense]|uniref:Uncharacterized protein n=1 Tax=Paraconiothyrium brasiliense TaxID=300254 RepID=A0ABR3RH34_9PLEO